MKRILYTITVLLLAAAAFAQDSSCRFGAQGTSWVQSRTMPALTNVGDTVTLELCLYAEFVSQFENRSPLGPSLCHVTGQAIRFEVAFDPGFVTEIADVVVPVADVVFFVGPFDGVEDFAGFSGGSVETEASQLLTQVLAVNDPAFFQSDFTVWCRATAEPTFQITGDGAFTLVSTPEAGAGVVFSSPVTPLFAPTVHDGLVQRPPLRHGAP